MSMPMNATDTPMTGAAAPDQRFDDAMREQHSRAVDAVSPRVIAQLRLRRSAALSGTPAKTPARRFGWPMGAAVGASFAALLAVAIGVQLPQTATSPVGDHPAMVAATTADDDLDTLLDENPDFYVWLASSDANTLAME